MSKNISKNVSRKYSQKFIHHAKQSAAGVLKNASKRAIQKTAEATGNIYIYIYTSRTDTKLWMI